MFMFMTVYVYVYVYVLDFCCNAMDETNIHCIPFVKRL